MTFIAIATVVACTCKARALDATGCSAYRLGDIVCIGATKRESSAIREIIIVIRESLVAILKVLQALLSRRWWDELGVLFAGSGLGGGMLDKTAPMIE